MMACVAVFGLRWCNMCIHRAIIMFKKSIAVASLLCAASAFAQESPSRQLEAGKTADMNNWMWKAQQQRDLSEGAQAAKAVTDAVQAKNCTGAVAALNTGLAKAHNEVLVLAGAMFQDGICVKANWDRAVRFYERAHAAGSPVAAPHLVAGYASTAGGRDLGTALWWAAKANTAVPSACADVVPLANDTTQFVAALNKWPAGQLQGCAYAAAVMASVQADAASHELQASLGLKGTLKIAFSPASGQMSFEQDLGLAPTNKVALDAGNQERAMRNALAEHLRDLAERSVKRFEKPTSMAPDWRVAAEIAFSPKG